LKEVISVVNRIVGVKGKTDPNYMGHINIYRIGRKREPI